MIEGLFTEVNMADVEHSMADAEDWVHVLSPAIFRLIEQVDVGHGEFVAGGRDDTADITMRGAFGDDTFVPAAAEVETEGDDYRGFLAIIGQG